jgi:hypothetical protein
MTSKNELLDQLFDEILTLPRFQLYTVAQQKALKAQLAAEYDERINQLIVASIPIDKAEEFLVVLDTGETEKIDAFISEHIPNIDDLLEAETTQFIQMIIRMGYDEQ